MPHPLRRPPVTLWKLVLAPCLVGLLLHAFVLLRAWPEPARFLMPPDSAEYVTLATNLLDGHGFSQATAAPYEGDVRRTPAYPAALAAAFALGGRSPRVAALMNGLLGLATLLVVGAAARIGGARMAVMAGLLAAIDLTSIGYHHLALTETLFALLLCGAVAVLIIRPPGVPPGVGAGVLLGLATLCRPIAVLMAPALLPVYLWRARRGRAVAMREYLVLNLCSGVLVGAWVLRNLVVAGVLTLTTVSGMNMYLHRAAYVEAGLSGRDVEDVRAELERTLDDRTRGMSEAERLRWLDEQGSTVVAAHPAAYVWASLDGLGRMLGPDRDAMWQVLAVRPGTPSAAVLDLAGWAQLALVYALAIVGGVKAWRGGAVREMPILIGTVLIYFALIGGPEMYPRFRMPLMPLVSILAGCAFRDDVERGA